MHEQLLTSVLSDLNRSSIDITASAVISTDGLPIAHILPNNVDADRVGAMSAALLALGNRTIHGIIVRRIGTGYRKRHGGLYFAYPSGRLSRSVLNCKRKCETGLDFVGCPSCGAQRCGYH